MYLSLVVRFMFWAVFGLVVLVVASALLIEIRFVDWVASTASGSSTDIRSLTRVSDLSDVVRSHKDTIDLSIKAIGLAFTIIIGSLTFLVGWYYASFNLPLRLSEYVAHLRTRHLDNRAAALSAYFSRNLNGDVVPMVGGYLSRLLFMFTPSHYRVVAIHKSVRRAGMLDAEVGVLDESLHLTKSRRITVHLVSGLDLASVARSMEPGLHQFEKSEAALEEFRKALNLNPRDLDALEAAAKQAKALNLNAEAQKYLERMIDAATHGQPTKHARALRYQAELLEARGTRAALREARAKLDTALGLLSSQSADDEKVLELALINEQLASLHLKRGTPTLVEGYLNEGERLFAKVPAPEGPAGLQRIADLRRLHVRALQGEDENDDVDLAITHFTIEIVAVYNRSDATSAPIRQLPKFAGVTVLNEFDGWSEIARGKSRLGYVESIKLQAVQ